MNSTPNKRTGKPVAAITVVPVGVSKLNCEAVCGLTERQLYELGRAHKLPRLPGKVPVYRADALLALFASDRPMVAAEATTDEPTSADAILALLGRRAAGSR